MKEMLKKFVSNEDGASAVEYGLLVALIAVALIGAMTALKNGISTAFNNAATQMSSGSSGS